MFGPQCLNWIIIPLLELDGFLEISLMKIVSLLEMKLGFQLRVIIKKKAQTMMKHLPLLLLLAFTCAINFKIFQMDVKSVFPQWLYYRKGLCLQPPNFEDNLYHVFKLQKALYDLKQAFRAWYERLSEFFYWRRLQKRKDRYHILHKRKGKRNLTCTSVC